MVKKIILFLLLLAATGSIYAQQATVDSSANFSNGIRHLRISLLTCGPGDEEVWEVFGHTALRVIDSDQHTDIVFNYGTFEFGPNFEMQFMRGKLNYCLAEETFNGFMQEYVEAKRSVQEQVLLLDWKQKEHIYDFLQWNADPVNRYYKYDFFFDNCATRIRDLFPRPEVFGKKFQFGNALPAGKALSFRDIINQYFHRDYWTRFGVNLLLGSRIDRVMTNKDIMFLPDYLRDGVGGGTVNGRPIATPPVLLLPAGNTLSDGTNWALMLALGLALLTIAGLTIKPLRIMGRVMSSLLLLVTGLLGCLMLVMWFGTDHQGCANNYNVLWCLPTNIIIAFFNPKGKGKYAIIAIILIVVSLLLHLLKVQCLLMPEFLPLLVSLLFIYGSIYVKSKNKAELKSIDNHA